MVLEELFRLADEAQEVLDETLTEGDRDEIQNIYGDVNRRSPSALGTKLVRRRPVQATSSPLCTFSTKMVASSPHREQRM